MGISRFDLVIENVHTGVEINRSWTKEALLTNIPWLKRMNAMGNDVRIRPAGPHALILIRDIDINNLDGLKARGLSPALVVEPVNGQLEAWIKMAGQPIEGAARATAAAAVLVVVHHAGDDNEIDQYGRLAGLTNRGAGLSSGGESKYVLLRESSGTTARNAERYLVPKQGTLFPGVTKTLRTNVNLPEQASHDHKKGRSR